MIRILLILALCGGIFIASAAAAEKQAATRAVSIAMLYHKLLKAEPNFRGWIEQTSEYKNAELYQRVQIMRTRLPEIEKTYGLMSAIEPVTLPTSSALSAYNPKAKGFMIRNFHELSFFPVTYMGENYAIVPRDIRARQWIRATPELAAIIWKESDGGKKARLQITLMPRAADETPINILGREYRLIMMEVEKVELWSKDNTRLLWSSDDMNPVKSKLLGLYR